MENNDLPGLSTEVFQITLKKDYSPKYIYGIDPCKSEPKNFWHKIRKFFGLKYKRKFSSSVGTLCKVYENGKVEVIL